jgi:hypothetical protein
MPIPVDINDVQLVRLRVALREFIMEANDAAASTIWNMRVRPVLAGVARALGVSRAVALEATGFMSREGFFLTCTELTVLEQAGAATSAGRLARAGNVFLLVLALTGEASAETLRSSDNEMAYRRYLQTYMGFCLRNMAMKGFLNLPEPRTYPLWCQALRNGELTDWEHGNVKAGF